MQEKDLFVKLSKNEGQKLLKELPHMKINIQIRGKGANTTEKFIFDYYHKESSNMYIKKTSSDDQLVSSEVLVNFEYAQLQYFTTSKLIKHSNNIYYLPITNNIFKCDKRKDFRIDADMLSDFTVTINEVAYQGQDLSAGGVGLLIPTHATDFFSDESFNNIIISFEDKKLKIDKAKRVYMRQSLSSIRNINFFKVGLKFSHIKDEVQAELFREINHALYKKIKG